VVSRGSIAVLIACLAVLGPAIAGNKDRKVLLKFAVEMAKSGNWREARYRWEKVSDHDPDDPYVLNNIAVALEALGKYDAAEQTYRRAERLSGGDAVIHENARRLDYLRRSIAKDEAKDESAPTAAVAPSVGKSKAPKAVKVQVSVPIPPRLDLTGMHTLLVASFLSDDTERLDAGREMVRFLRSEFRRKTALEVLDVTPPPAVPEQRLEDLIANHEFWKYLGREHGADLIVSGQVEFDRRDASGFRDVDVISNVTGQKIRTTRFVEQEEFLYRVHLLFFDGKTGELRFQDQLSRSVTYQGLGNDSLTAFYGLSELIAGDVLSVVTSHTRDEQRVIFAG
jgi:hypothetical protein